MKIDWKKVNNLLPVIVQEDITNEVLMLAYMNEEAFNLTLQTKLAHYFSRTKNKIWKKGEESGNIQIVKSMFLDCDNDTLLIKVEQIGGMACHTGRKSCFFNEISLISQQIKQHNSEEKPIKYGILDEIYHTCLDRKLNNRNEKSYISSLYKKGENSYLKKISEEACELALACKDLSKAQMYFKFNLEKFGEHEENNPKKDVIYESADVLFHMIVALADHAIHPEAVLQELKRRQGISGLEEKASRKS